MTLLGIDIGSSAVKAALFDLAGRQLRVARIACPSAGEFDPHGWWVAVESALTQLADDSVEAIGVCGRGGTNVLLDAGRRPCGPSWDDRRANDVTRELRQSRPDVPPASLGLLAKGLSWKRAEPRVASVCAAKDYVVLQLTGELVSDPASGGVWSLAGEPELVGCREPWALAGFTKTVPGLRDGIPVSVGWHDGAAATFGAGAAAAGTASITLGTNAVYRVVTGSLPATLNKYWDLTPGLTVTGGDILGAGRTFAWAQALFPGTIEASEPGAGGTLFLPQAYGRIAPDMDFAARAAWTGIGANTTGADLLCAVVEGVGYSLRQVRDWLAEHGVQAERTVATGGGAHSPRQAQVLSDVLGQPVQVAAFEEGARGAALLGAVAANLLSLEEARTAPADGCTYEPHAATRELYDHGYARWLALQAAESEARPD